MSLTLFGELMDASVEVSTSCPFNLGKLFVYL